MSLDEPPPKDPVPPVPLPPTQPIPPATRFAAKPPAIYSVPRRFDLATLFVVSFAFALMFGACRFIGIRPVGVLVLSGSIALIGLSQAVLFQGNRPRLASLVAGGAICLVADSLARLVFLQVPYLAELFFATASGAILGYLAGCLVGTVFMLAEFCRTAIECTRSSNCKD